jgi:hypothetical protein
MRGWAIEDQAAGSSSSRQRSQLTRSASDVDIAVIRPCPPPMIYRLFLGLVPCDVHLLRRANYILLELPLPFFITVANLMDGYQAMSKCILANKSICAAHSVLYIVTIQRTVCESGAKKNSVGHSRDLYGSVNHPAVWLKLLQSPKRSFR